MKQAVSLVLTCEHGGNRVPRRYGHLFAGARAQAALVTHRGYDIGALWLAKYLAREFEAPLYYSTVTRLLVELNKSVGHPKFRSEFVAGLRPSEHQALVERYHRPHWLTITEEIARRVARGERVLHLAIHSFTPRLRGETRTADVGLLYDPRRTLERRLCAQWKEILAGVDPTFRVRRNYPYLGRGDGLATNLRRRFRDREYLGIEFETNQALWRHSPGQQRVAAESLAESLRRLCVGDRLR